ncbi:unnamed protein product, partial [Mycena citricolor]
CCSTRLTIFPLGVVIVVLFTCSGITRICSYASWPSIRDRKRHRATRRSIPSMSGSGDAIFRVFALRSRRSTTTRSRGGLDFALGISNIGTVFPAFVIFQRPVFRYTRRFSSHWGLSASGHRDIRHGMTLPGSINGML